MSHGIRKVAVLGAGTMGAAIAAHCANAGLEVDLLDIAPDDDDNNAVVEGGFERMKNARPAALMADDVADRITIGNFQDDFDRVGEADWIVEAIIEKLEPKRELMQRVEETAKEDAIISTNTSGIPLHEISEGRSEDFKKRFVGTHFFNPPRYLKLMEIIPTEDTDPEIVEAIRKFGERVLGKGGVIAKDTPNFIGNRIGTFAGMQSARYAFENGYGIEEVDAITGPLIGHPKTATFRLNDQVGLDIAVGVAENLYEAVPEDESREELKPPEKLEEMQERELLGNKTGGGFYKRDRREGKTVFDVLDLETFEHHPAEDPEIPIAEEAQKQGDLAARLRFLIDKADEDKHARYIRDTLLPYMAYASRRVPEISDTLEDVDHAMEWGFAHQTGPFRTWDLLGVQETVDKMRSMDVEVGGWVEEMLDAGNDGFYKTEDGTELQFSPVERQYVPVREDPMYVSLDRLREEGKELERNDSASLLDLGDGVLCLEFHSKGNSLDAQIVEMGNRALEALERDDVVGLVIGNEGRNFSVGANLGEVAHAPEPPHGLPLRPEARRLRPTRPDARRGARGLPPLRQDRGRRRDIHGPGRDRCGSDPGRRGHQRDGPPPPRPGDPHRPEHPAAPLPPKGLRTDSLSQDRNQRPRSEGHGLPHRGRPRGNERWPPHLRRQARGPGPRRRLRPARARRQRLRRR
jgi:3-hydroxyacyl-CoA dehydrogenase